MFISKKSELPHVEHLLNADKSNQPSKNKKHIYQIQSQQQYLQKQKFSNNCDNNNNIKKYSNLSTATAIATTTTTTAAKTTTSSNKITPVSNASSKSTFIPVAGNNKIKKSSDTTLAVTPAPNSTNAISSYNRKSNSTNVSHNATQQQQK